MRIAELSEDRVRILEVVELIWRCFQLWLVVVVANMGLRLCLPHGSGVRVANQSCNGNLPHGKGWNIWVLIGDS